MKVILKEEVVNLGDIGSVVDVADGYGRNYLIPKKLAVEANPRNIRQFEHEKKLIAGKAEMIKKERADLAEKMSAINLSIEARAGEDGKLFGSVTNKDIADALLKNGHDVDKRKIILPEESIKRIGTYAIKVKLHQDVSADVNLEVVPEHSPSESEG